MKIIYTPLLSLMLLASPSIAQDVLGWNDTRWGMTPEQVITATDGQAKTPTKLKKHQGLTGELEIEGLAVQGFTFHVLLWFRDGKLDQVELEAQDVHHGMMEHRAKGARSGAYYDELRTLLADKYGPPVTDSREMSNGIHTNWSFPNTTISMQVTPGFITPTTKVIYRAIQKDMKSL
jgi:hypothetical protein